VPPVTAIDGTQTTTAGSVPSFHGVGEILAPM
jgi:hypothetical protein